MKRDEVRLRHMLDAAKEAVAFSEGSTRRDLEQNRLLALSLVKLIEMVGEAANQVTPEFQAQTPAIPWREVIATRHRLIHGYDSIDFDIVWQTVTGDFSELIAELEKVVGRGG